MMSNSIVLSERQRPRAIQIMKELYASHACPTRAVGMDCSMMVSLRQRIEEEEKLLDERDPSRSFGSK